MYTRIIIFALMIFGSFANFAQNIWGNTIIYICQILLGLSFFYEMAQILFLRIKGQQRKKFNITLLVLSISLLMSMIIQHGILMVSIFFLLSTIFIYDALTEKKLNKNGNVYLKGTFENYILFLAFTCLAIKNLHFEGAGVLIVFTGIALFMPYYLSQAFNTKKYSNLSVGARSILFVIYLNVTIIGVGAVFKIMHYPGANILFMVGSLVSLLLILLIIFAPIKNNLGTKITRLEFLKTPSTHVIFLFVIMSIRLFHIVLNMQGLAPGFYENRFPQVATDLKNSGKASDAEKAEEIADAYINFIEHCKSNGTLPN